MPSVKERQRLDVLQVADVVRDERVPLLGQAEGVLQLGAAGRAPGAGSRRAAGPAPGT